MRIFLDANILFSAAAFADGAVARLVRLLRAGGHECWADLYVVTEARRNLAAKEPSAVAALAQLIDALEVVPASDSDLGAIPGLDLLPAKDRPVLAAAIRCGCEALLTDDRTHFGALHGQTISGVKILSPRQLAETLWP